MKGMAVKLQLSRKFVFILGGLLLLGGASGAAAVYIGAERILGPSYAQLNGFACSSVKTVNIKKKDRFWVRQFIKTEPTDGLTRVRTALRVAHAIYEKDKPDLVQVVVLDTNGPTDRADMRGRSVGADVIYVAHPENMPDDVENVAYSAHYSDGAARDGQFYGQRIDMPIDDIEHLVGALNDKAGCVDPVVASAGAGAHGADKKKKEGAGHEAPAAHGEAAAPVEEHAAATSDAEHKTSETEKHAAPEAASEPVADHAAEADGSDAHAAPEAGKPAEPATH